MNEERLTRVCQLLFYITCLDPDFCRICVLVYFMIRISVRQVCFIFRISNHWYELIFLVNTSACRLRLYERITINILCEGNDFSQAVRSVCKMDHVIAVEYFVSILRIYFARFTSVMGVL